MPARLVILDRDGVINHDSSDFIKSPDEWVPIEGSIEAIVKMSAAGMIVAIASNQSGIARKLLDEAALHAIHEKLRESVQSRGGTLGRIVYCPHHPDDHCDCRKPLPGLLSQIERHYGLPLDRVPVIGDSERDLLAAKAVNARPILVLTGNGRQTEATLKARGDSVETYADLLTAAGKVVAEENGSLRS